ncbi:MAG: MBL fold metallo-hydrolase, partial [Candidatus Limnocylindria bacterium]
MTPRARITGEPLVERAATAAQPGHPARIEVGAFGPWETNAYLVWDGHSPDALVFDPGMGAAATLMDRATAHGLRLHLIANSHGHIDHIFDNGPLVRASGAPLAIHPDDAYRLTGENVYGFNVERSVATQDLREGEQVGIGDLVFDVLHTPGHT